MSYTEQTCTPAHQPQNITTSPVARHNMGLFPRPQLIKMIPARPSLSNVTRPAGPAAAGRGNDQTRDRSALQTSPPNRATPLPICVFQGLTVNKPPRNTRSLAGNWWRKHDPSSPTYASAMLGGECEYLKLKDLTAALRLPCLRQRWTLRAVDRGRRMPAGISHLRMKMK